MPGKGRARVPRERLIVGDELQQYGLLGIVVRKLLCSDHLPDWENHAICGFASQGDEGLHAYTVIVDNRQRQAELTILHRDGGGRRWNCMHHQRFSTCRADLGELRGEVGVFRFEGFFSHDLDTCAHYGILQRQARILAERVVDVKAANFADPDRLQVGHLDGGHMLVALRGLESPEALGHRFYDRTTGSHGDKGNLCLLDDRHSNRDADRAAGAAHDDHHAIFIDELLGQRDGDVWVAFGVLDEDFHRVEHAIRACNPTAGCCQLVCHHERRVALRLAQEGCAAGDCGHEPDLIWLAHDGFFFVLLHLLFVLVLLGDRRGGRRFGRLLRGGRLAGS